MAILPTLALKEYHENYPDLPSPSVLSAALKSPAHLAYYLQTPRKPTDEYNFGSLIHEFIENNFVFPDKLYTEEAEVYKRATGDAQAGDPKLDDDGDPKFTYVCTVDPERTLTASNSKKAKAVMKGLSECDEVKAYLAEGKVVVEQSMTGEINGVKVKCRPDILIEFKDKIVLLEIKTTRHGLVDLMGFSRDFFDMNYDMQCCFEAEITQQNYPDKPVEVLVLAVSSDMPAGAAIVDMPDTLVEIGKAKIIDALAVWATKPTKTFYFTKGTLGISYMATEYRARKGIE